ncbi:MAG TPA: hypothetical protein H9889_09155 [Candidatus Ignatzschineria merdigallinarum]|uniref:Uncharacterized protein n=1 Tax=Candidatus Ignatzschineria merdigallinarum TaxID=2838621 RepID=A0A9D1TV47_9GAMM|nr:hypothetical protein [Candidatus Ignatzschineria merdigallinarum]
MNIPLSEELLSLSRDDFEIKNSALNIPGKIKEVVKSSFDQRLNSADSYNKFLIFCCDIGRLDIVYYVSQFIDKDRELLQQYIEKIPNIQRILKFSEIKDIARLQQLSMHEISFKDAVLLKEQFFTFLREMRKSGAALFMDNMTLSFSLTLLLRTDFALLDKDECVEIVEYFKNVEKTEQIRRNTCYLLIFDYVIKHNLDAFFTLPKRHFNHLTYVQYALTATSFLSKEMKSNLFHLFKDKIKHQNNLSNTRKLKFAVCISGLYRNHPDVLQSIKTNLIDSLDADVFVHTWDQMSYWTGYGGSPSCWRTLGMDAQRQLPQKYHHNLRDLQSILPKTTHILSTPLMTSNDVELLKGILNPTAILVENETDFIASLSNPSGFTKLRGTYNQIKMFWGIKQSFDLALAEGKYDVIIRIRPDTAVMNEITPLFFENIENNVLYSRTWPKTGIADATFYFTDSVAYIFSRFVDQMMDKQALSPFDKYPEYDAHALLAAWVFDNNLQLDPKYIPTVIQVNPTTKLEGLSDALDQDYAALDDDKKEALVGFIDYLRDTYC